MHYPPCMQKMKANDELVQKFLLTVICLIGLTHKTDAYNNQIWGQRAMLITRRSVHGLACSFHSCDFSFSGYIHIPFEIHVQILKYKSEFAFRVYHVQQPVCKSHLEMEIALPWLIEVLTWQYLLPRRVVLPVLIHPPSYIILAELRLL